MESLYAADGVNIELGDSFSKFANQLCRSTWSASPFVEVHDFSEHFRGPRGYSYKMLPRGYFNMVAPDGIGTKVVVITAARAHRRAARDVLAMTMADITRWGGMPLIFCNVFDVETLGAKDSETFSLYGDAFKGLQEAAVEQGIVLLSGETAELGACVGSENPDAVTKFNWAGFALGVSHPKRIITGKDIRPGQVVIALRECGFRSNGISSVRKALAKQFGEKWWVSKAAKEWILAAATPSALYDHFLARINGWHSPTFEPLIPLTAIIHVSGGGIPGKFGEDILFPLGLSAVLDNLYEPPEVMKQCALWRGMPSEEAYKTWNGGQGALLVMEPQYGERFLMYAREAGVEAKRVGEVKPAYGKPILTIHSTYDGEKLVYQPKAAQ